MSVPQSSTAASKQLHYANLNDQLDQLNKNITRLDKNISTINEHVPIVRKIGILHTAMSMSATKVLNDKNHQKTSEGQ